MSGAAKVHQHLSSLFDLTRMPSLDVVALFEVDMLPWPGTYTCASETCHPSGTVWYAIMKKLVHLL